MGGLHFLYSNLVQHSDVVQNADVVQNPRVGQLIVVETSMKLDGLDQTRPNLES